MERKKVVVGLSGGVDSSVAAYLLKEQGYQVIGLFMRNWDSTLNNDVKGNTEFNNEVCPQELDYIDAKKVAEKLGIELHRVDFVKEYWDYVFEYFLSEYKKGRTPNPDILCNKYIKFDKFMEHAITKLDADYIAMGHYAGVKLNTKTNQFELLKAIDENKDQTYFLCQLTQDQLSKTLFPLYKYKKEEIRAIAKEQDLATAEKKDSTGICFIGERQFTKFLENYIPNQPGDIVDIKTGKILGKHIGVMYYTIGQRKGLNLGGMSEPYYVADKDIDKKILYVSSSSDESYLQSTSCIVKDINWIVNLEKYFENSNEFRCMAKFRYRQKDNKVTVIKLDESNYKIVFDEMSKAVTIGQEAVFYLGDVCLGGGIIDKVDK